MLIFFFNKPIIAYAIETALESNLFDKVIVSTDSQEISDVAKKHGADVPFIRSAKNSSDFASTVDVLLEVFVYGYLINFIIESQKKY
jgi:pseudaminic acid cytidylyltransferase